MKRLGIPSDQPRLLDFTIQTNVRLIKIFVSRLIEFFADVDLDQRTARLHPADQALCVGEKAPTVSGIALRALESPGIEDLGAHVGEDVLVRGWVVGAVVGATVGATVGVGLQRLGRWLGIRHLHNSEGSDPRRHLRLTADS